MGKEKVATSSKHMKLNMAIEALFFLPPGHVNIGSSNIYFRTTSFASNYQSGFKLSRTQISAHLQTGLARSPLDGSFKKKQLAVSPTQPFALIKTNRTHYFVKRRYRRSFFRRAARIQPTQSGARLEKKEGKKEA